MTPRLHCDPAVDAAYLRFLDAQVVEGEEVSRDVVLNFDRDGRIVAMEVMNAARRPPSGALAAAA